MHSIPNERRMLATHPQHFHFHRALGSESGIQIEFTEFEITLLDKLRKNAFELGKSGFILVRERALYSKKIPLAAGRNGVAPSHDLFDTCLLHIANPDGLKELESLMGRWERKVHHCVQLLVSRSPLRPAMLPRLIYPSEVRLEPSPSLASIGHLARHHTQVNCAALRRPANKTRPSQR